MDAARVTPPSATPRGEFNPKPLDSNVERLEEEPTAPPASLPTLRGPDPASRLEFSDNALGLRLFRLRDEPTPVRPARAADEDADEDETAPLDGVRSSFLPPTPTSASLAPPQCSMSPCDDTLAIFLSSNRVVRAHRRLAPHSFRPCPFLELSTRRHTSSLPRALCMSASASTAVARTRFMSVLESSNPLPPVLSFADAMATSLDTISALETSGCGNLSGLSMALINAQTASSLSLASAGPSRGMDRSLENLPPPS